MHIAGYPPKRHKTGRGELLLEAIIIPPLEFAGKVRSKIVNFIYYWCILMPKKN